MVIKTLDGSTCKKYKISISATYIWHTCVKVKMKWSSQKKMELTNNSELEHISSFPLKNSLSLHKKVSSKLSFKNIKLHLKSKKCGYVNIEQIILSKWNWR